MNFITTGRFSFSRLMYGLALFKICSFSVVVQVLFEGLSCVATSSKMKNKQEIDMLIHQLRFETHIISVLSFFKHVWQAMREMSMFVSTYTRMGQCSGIATSC